MAEQSRPQQDHIKTLTSLRFFAVLLIVMHHLKSPFIPALQHNENFGVMGVTFFLFLSGFIMAFHYRAFTSLKISFYFLWNRYIRIYPVHMLTFFLSVLIMLFIERWNIANLSFSTAVLNILLLHSYSPLREIFFSFNSVSWTLSTLFLFYVLFSMANHWDKGFLIVLLGTMVCIIICLAHIQTSEKGDFLWYRLWLLYIFPPNRLFTCILGVLAFKMLYGYYARLAASSSIVLFTLYEAAALLAIIDFLAWGWASGLLRGLLCELHFPFKKGLDLFVSNYLASTVAASFAIIVFSSGKGLISKALTKRPFLALGEISYCLFMCHQLIIRSVKPWAQGINMHNGTACLAIILLSVLVSFLIYNLVEEPIRRRFRVHV